MKKWPLWKKFTVFFLIALYFTGVFSAAYVYRLKQIDPPAYDTLVTNAANKYQELKKTIGNYKEKTSSFAAESLDSLTAFGYDIKSAVASKWQDTFSPNQDVYAQEPEITSPVSDLLDASYDTTETNHFQDQTSGETILTGGPYDIHYYMQTDPRWKDTFYGGQDTIGKYGCGPTALAMAVSSLTTTEITPDQMAAWALAHGYFSPGSGSYHSLISDGAKSFGLNVESLQEPTTKSIIEALCTGKIIVALMSQGHFTSSGHFLLIRGVTLDGKVLIADPLSLDNSLMAWEPEILVNELKKSASSGGPAWAISK